MTDRGLRLAPAPLATVALVLALAVGSAGCGTVQVPMKPTVGKVDVASPFPVEAALLVSREARERVFTGTPDGLAGNTRPHAFPLGAALESASQQAFSQVFKKVTVVRTREEARPFRLVIEPVVTDFRFGYEEQSQAAFAVAAVATAKVRVTVATPATTVWVKTLESPKQQSGTWVMKLHTEQEAGEAASAALAAALQRAALEVGSHPAVRQALGR